MIEAVTSTAAALEQIGSSIADRYRVEAKLGHGGMAAVYHVRDERTGAQLALKRGFARDPRKLQRNAALLEREYHTLAHLAHPRIIEVYDYGVDERGPYYTMELLDGTDLEGAGRLPWEKACAVLCDVASSLAILHSRGLVHRDVSLRNVRYTARGHAKLIDFGGMTSIGVAHDVVGTPPFMSPEVLQMQALDARADLFSLGALGYHLLTARHAYPARRLSDLRDAWRTRPQPPARFAEDVPPQLSALIMRLLTLDRSGRPQSAAEVIEQLKTLAQLTFEDVAETARAYLTTPALVGRDQALLDVRRAVLALTRGDGGALLVHGLPGSGRSRLLDACVLEAKLLGAAVVRADARAVPAGDWGLAQAICSQLIELFPKHAHAAARLSREVLAHVIDEFAPEEGNTVTGHTPERSLLLRELREFVLSIGNAQRLVIAVDDADRIDEPSAALLASLTHKAERRPVLLALTVDSDVRSASTGSLRLLWSLSRTVETTQLSADECEALMRSVFGDAANVSMCASRIHGLSRGNPRATMELAQHLVDTGRARYEAGGWVLPAALDERELPSSLAESLAARLRALSQDARELLDALMLADGDALPLGAYPQLTAHGSMRGVFSALDELVFARILIAGVERYDFATRAFLSVVLESLPTARRRVLHARIAQCLANSGGNILRRAHHMLAAGQDAEAIALLCQLDLAAVLPPVDLLATAIERAERLDVPARTLHRLRFALLVNAPLALASDAFRRVLPTVLAQLEHDSGLAAYRELAHVPDEGRLTQALVRTQEQHQRLPEHERVLGVVDAIRDLARLSGALCSLAHPVFDLELLDSLPSLTPLLPLSPALQVVSQVVEASKQSLRCRLLLAYDLQQQVLERIMQPDRGGLEEALHARIRDGMEIAIGMFEASFGMASAEDRARRFDGSPELRVNAWRIRTLLQLGLGNPAEARKCARRAELLQAQQGLIERYVRSTAGIELLLSARLRDLIAVKSSLEDLAALSARHPGWRPVELLGRSRYCELQGDLPGALAHVLAGLELARPLRHPFFAALAGVRVQLLWALGRKDEALELTREYIELCRREEISSNDLYLAAGLVLGQAGEFALACDTLDHAIETGEQRHRSGFGMGTLYEARARVAIWMDDRDGFERYAAQSGLAYATSKNPAFGSALEELFDEARQHGILPSDAALAARDSLQPPPPESEHETVHSRIAECIDRRDRGRCALTLLLQTTTSASGHLYGTASFGALELLASLPEGAPEPGLDAWVEQHARAAFAQEQLDESATTGDEVEADSDTDDGHGSQLRSRYRDRDGLVWQARPLFEGRRLAGMLVLPVAGAQTVLLHELCTKIARELLEHGDATGWHAP